MIAWFVYIYTDAYAKLDAMKAIPPPVSRGFTIIEVLIVLAIAGLILLIVFFAVPSLQRTNRNYQRKNATNYVAGELISYNALRGKYPLSGTTAASDDRANFIASLNNQGPTKAFGIRFVDGDASHEYPYSGTGAPASPSDVLDEISIQPGHICNRAPGIGPGNSDYPVKVSQFGDNSYKQYAIWTLLEGANVYCVDTDN